MMYIYAHRNACVCADALRVMLFAGRLERSLKAWKISLGEAGCY